MEVHLSAMFSIWWKQTDFRNLTDVGRIDKVGREEEADDGCEHGQEDAEYEGGDDEKEEAEYEEANDEREDTEDGKGKKDEDAKVNWRHVEQRRWIDLI